MSKKPQTQAQIIKKALALEIGKNPDEVTHLSLAKLAGFTDNELKMVEIFWEPAFNDSWIYVSSELIHDLFGYAKTGSSTRDFYRKLADNFKATSEFMEVDKNHELVVKYYESCLEKFPKMKFKDVANKKYFIISGKTLKLSAMMANTTKGRETCDYFLKVEELCILLSKYTVKRMKAEHKKDVQKMIEDSSKWNTMHARGYSNLEEQVKELKLICQKWKNDYVALLNKLKD